MPNDELFVRTVVEALRDLEGRLRAEFAERVAVQSAQLDAMVARLVVVESREPMPGRDGRDGTTGERGLMGERGLPGEPGPMGPVGPPGPAGVAGAKGERGESGPAGPAGVTGECGEAGPPGPAGLSGAKGERGDVGPSGPAGERGLDGRDVDPAILQGLRQDLAVLRADLEGFKSLPRLTAEDVAAQITRALSTLPTPRDGRDGLPGVPGPPGPPGERGTDGRAGLDGTHGVDGTAGRDGWSFEEFDWERDDDGRLYATFRRGDEVKRAWVPCFIDRGVWVSGERYRLGDGVTWRGAFWLAQADTMAKPGEASPESRAWRLAVKAGRDAKPLPPTDGSHG